MLAAPWRSESGSDANLIKSAFHRNALQILRLLRYNRRRLNSVLTQTQPVTAQSNRRLAGIALVVAAIGALWFILFWQLSNEWSINEQYSYGWLVPFFALFFFWLRWEDRPDPEIRSQRSQGGNNRRALVASLIAFPALFLLHPCLCNEQGAILKLADGIR